MNWGKKRTARLKKLYPATPRDELLAEFPGFTWEAIRKKAKRLGLTRTHGVSDQQVSEGEMLKRLETLGYQLVKTPQLTDHVTQIDLRRFEGERYKFGIVSDTHLGSKYQQLSHLNAIYRRFSDEGIDTVLHIGDWLEGEKMYRGQEYGIFVHGADAQVEYAIANYPRVPGVNTYGISGNHDLSYMKHAGMDVVQRICDSRDDLRYLGPIGGFIELPGGFRVYLHHPRGSCSYARSYRLQKNIENFESGSKPRLYCVGHYHVTVTLPDYRNTFSMICGAFQSQTPFLKELGLAPDVGGWVIEYQVNPNASRFDLVSVRAEWIPFRKVVPNDY